MDRKAIRRLLGKRDWDENPLEVVGLTPAILELGLSESELYDYCRRIARDLMARVHPDRHGGVEAPAVKRYSRALDLLQDPKVFREALTDFREAKVYQRRSERVLAETNALLQTNNQELNRKLVEQNSTLEREKRFRQWALRYLVTLDTSRFGLGVKHVSGSATLVMSSLVISFSDPPDSGVEDELKALYQKAVRVLTLSGHRRAMPYFGKARGFMAEHHLMSAPLSGVLKQALQSSIKVPGVVWDFETAAHVMGLPKLAPWHRIANRQPIRETPEEVKVGAAGELQKGLLRYLLHRFGDRHVDHVEIVPAKYHLNNHIVRDQKDLTQRVVVGSVDLDEGLPLTQPSLLSGQLGLVEEILPQTEPFIIPGKAVVTLSAGAIEGSLGNDKDGDKFRGAVSRGVVDTRLLLSHFVLSCD
ncbi:MAG: hypothetical protein A2Z42_03875 [Candidatus Woykebacteria bacterium RBG_19FT_COMBO_43_10]|uniref:J domain-containing protein n=1 Tax=Candidatus Woykebacteria bacterium RBG_19FT_COMBO_43_10 TaxID=1802598 RepID=A0A1G1WKG5_9BACT|nr:MAG: hypothetical protein A2Z42_03875 [Candidatus Woykebacteria bacterium RBG_19FT_COMBO_43_10]